MFIFLAFGRVNFELLTWTNINFLWISLWNYQIAGSIEQPEMMKEKVRNFCITESALKFMFRNIISFRHQDNLDEI